MVRLLVLLVSLVLATEVMPQELEYYPYETESKEHFTMLTTDSVLFYRAVQSPADIYGQIADYNLSFVRVARRGQEYDLRSALLNGVEVPMRSFAVLKALGATEEHTAGLQPVAMGLGLTGGVRIFRFDDGDPLSAGRTSVNLSGRNYLVAAKASYMAILGRGWSVSASVDVRTGRDIYVGGVFSNSMTAALRLDKRFAGGHRLSFVVITPPSMRGLRSASVAEAFALTGDNLYNPAWGFQSGKVRNSHVRRDFLPLIIASSEFRISQTTELSVALGCEVGTSKYSTLGWYDARTPLPDNYRYLPSYVGDRETDQAWQTNDVRYTQINWDELYAQNNMKGGSAIYALEDRVESVCNLRFNGLFTTQFDDRLTLSYGVVAHYASERNYKQMRDLLGSSHIEDVDYFLVDDDTYGNRMQNDMRHPQRRVVEGDRFGYDYMFGHAEIGARVLMQYRSDRFRVDFGGEVRDASLHRYGFFEKELYSGVNSYGPSAKLRFTPYVFKLSSGWAFSPRSYLGVVVAAAATTPDADALFFQPQYNNRTVGNSSLRNLYSAELTFNHTGRMVDLRAVAFATYSMNGMDAFRYYDDLASVFCNMSVTGIGVRSMGLEAAALFRLSYRWRLSVAACVGEYVYSADPRITVVTDVDNSLVDMDGVSRMRSCRVGNAPQITTVVEGSYFGAKGWGFRAGVNYAGLRYATPAFLRRTDRLTSQVAHTPESFDSFTEQERLVDAFTLDASVFKSFRFGDSRLTISLMLRNILNHRAMVYSAYESLRVRRSRSGDLYHYAPQETRRMYGYPRSFYLTISFKF